MNKHIIFSITAAVMAFLLWLEVSFEVARTITVLYIITYTTLMLFFKYTEKDLTDLVDKVTTTVPAKEIRKRINKKVKGKNYEDLIAKLYTARGYTVIENGKYEGRRDGGIDLIATKINKTILIQCKDWSKTSKYRIRHQEIKKLRSEARDFMESHREYVVSDMKLLFVLSEDCVHPSARHHLQDIQNKGKKVDIEIISTLSANKETSTALEILIKKRNNCPRCGHGFLIKRERKNSKYHDKYANNEFLGCSRYPKCRYSEAVNQDV
jgi:Holliday junction resolvase-like predicted endonuclease